MPHHHHSHDHHHGPALLPADAPRLMRMAGYASVSVASILLVSKLYAWWDTESLAMLSSLTDSVFDVITSIINLLAIRYALKPADDDHRFGHTAIEDIAGLTQFAFISAAMVLIILQSVERLTNPHMLANEALGMGVSMFAMLLTTGLVIFQTYVARTTRSLVVAADRMHYVSDIAFNLGVIAALGLSKYLGYTWADPAVAIIIALAILWHTREIGLRAFHNLMDREMPGPEKQAITDIIARFPEVQNMHRLKTRYSGSKAFIQMNIELDGALSFAAAHAITDRLEQALLAAYPGAEVIIHPDPVGAHTH